MSFIELFDFIFYQHLNKRTNILPLATSQIAHLCHQLNHVAVPISKPRFKSVIFNQNSPKMKLFLQKKGKIFETLVPPAARDSASRPRASGGWGLCPQPPSLRRLGALPQDLHWPPAAAPKSAPHCEFLAARLIGFL